MFRSVNFIIENLSRKICISVIIIHGHNNMIISVNNVNNVMNICYGYYMTTNSSIVFVGIPI